MLLHELWFSNPQRYSYINILGTQVYRKCAQLDASTFEPHIEHALQILRNASTVAARHDRVLSSEAEVDRFCEMLLIPSFPDLNSEPAVSLANSYRKPDTAIGSIQTFIEYKFLDNEGRRQDILDQMQADIRNYSRNGYKNLIFVVTQTQDYFREESLRVDLQEPSGFSRVEVITMRLPPRA